MENPISLALPLSLVFELPTMKDFRSYAIRVAGVCAFGCSAILTATCFAQSAPKNLNGEWEAAYAKLEREVRSGEFKYVEASVKELEALLEEFWLKGVKGLESRKRFCEDMRKVVAATEREQLLVSTAYRRLNEATQEESRGALDEATIRLFESYSLLRDSLGGDNEVVDGVRYQLIRNLAMLEMYRPSLQLSSEVLSYRRKAFGDESLDYADAMMTHAAVLAELDDVEGALKELRTAIAIRRSRDLTSLMFIRKMILVAECHSRLGHHEEAGALVMQCLRLTEKASMGAMNAAHGAGVLAQAELSYGHLDAADGHADTAIEACRKAYQPDVIEVADFLEQKAKIMVLMNNVSKANELKKEAQTIRDRIEKQRQVVVERIGSRLNNSSNK